MRWNYFNLHHLAAVTSVGEIKCQHQSHDISLTLSDTIATSLHLHGGHVNMGHLIQMLNLASDISTRCSGHPKGMETSYETRL